MGLGTGDAVALEIGSKLLVYILYRFSMAGFAVLVASVIRNPIGTLGLSAALIYLAVLTQNPVENSVMQDLTAFITITAILLFAATFIFIKRDLK